MSRLLVLGAGGQLGREIVEIARVEGIEVRGFSRSETDILDIAAVRRAVSDFRPKILLNSAAYTAVDKAESEPDKARAVNVDGSRNAALVAAEVDLPIIHISTDYVFDGQKHSAYVEDDAISPLGVYGKTKAEGERAVAEINPRHAIVRTSWLYSRFGHNFLKTVMTLCSTREHLRIVADQKGCPTSTIDLSYAILRIAESWEHGQTPYGTFHFAGSGTASWHTFATHIRDVQAEVTGRRPSIAAISTAEYPTPARRPMNSELDSSRFGAIFGFRAAPWQVRVRETVENIRAMGEIA